MLRNVITKHTYLLNKHGSFEKPHFTYYYKGLVISSYIAFKVFIANILDTS